MPTSTRTPFPTADIKKALDFLQENNFSAYLEKMALLGEWIQKNTGISQYKQYQETFTTRIKEIQKDRSLETTRLTSQQALAFEALQNAWQDRSLSRIRRIQFVSDPNTPCPAGTCLFLRTTQEPFWELIPHAQENPTLRLDLHTIENLAELAKKLPPQIVNQAPENYTLETQQLVKRLMKALKHANLAALDQKMLAAKADLAKEHRHGIKLGMEAFKILCPAPQQNSDFEEKISPALHFEVLTQEPSAAVIQAFPPHTYVIILTPEGGYHSAFFYQSKCRKQKINLKQLQQMQPGAAIEDLLLDYHCCQLDQAAGKAIHQYKTSLQKVTHFLGNVLAAITAFTYGTVEQSVTMLGLFVAAGIVWTNPWLAIAGVLLLAAAIIIPFPSTWTNWKVFSTYVPAFFNKICEEYQDIQTLRKKALFWGLALLAAATGIASGGLAYTATIAFPAMLGLGAISFIFPPLGLVFAAAVALCQAFTLIRNFTHILQKEDSWKAFKKPFLKVSKNLRDNDASLARQVFTWGIVIGLTILAVLGLAMSCFTSVRSVGKLFLDLLKTAPKTALACGIAISGVSSFLSRVYFTLDSAITSAILFCKQPSKPQTASIPRKNKATDFVAKPSSLSWDKIFAIAIDCVLAGAFYAQNLISLSQQSADDAANDINALRGLPAGPTAALASTAFITSTARYVAINYKHAGQPDDPHAEARCHAANQRVEKTKTFYRSPLHGLFTQQKSIPETPLLNLPWERSHT